MPSRFIIKIIMFSIFIGVIIYLSISQNASAQIKKEFCYQEFADKSTECGGLAKGNYSYIKYTQNSFNPSWLDGDYDTYSAILGQGSFGESNGGDAGEYFVEYAKPEKALKTSFIRIKDLYDSSYELDTITDKYYQVPEPCFNHPSLKFRFRLHGYSSLLLTGATFDASCWDGGNWIIFRSANGDDLAGLNDEAMVWDMALS